MSVANPKRGCGTKKHDAFYAEGGLFAAGGGLHPWVWTLGDGILDGDNIVAELPARQMLWVDPMMTIVTRSLVEARSKIALTDEEKERWKWIKGRTTTVGIGDHVGRSFYSIWSFAQEVMQYGPSRRMSPQFAKQVAMVVNKYGPVPIMFSHSRVPMFKNDIQRDEICRLANACLNNRLDWGEYNFNPTYQHADWGQFANRKQYRGQDHYMLPILTVLDRIERDWSAVRKNEAYQKLKEALEGVIFQEQIIGASWILRVSYTLPEAGGVNAKQVEKLGEDLFKKLNILNLKEVENVS